MEIYFDSQLYRYSLLQNSVEEHLFFQGDSSNDKAHKGISRLSTHCFKHTLTVDLEMWNSQYMATSSLNHCSFTMLQTPPQDTI